MKAVITVIGKDTVGIISKISEKCAQNNVNICDITQKVLGDIFVMIMIVDISNIKEKFTDFVEQIDQLGNSMGLSIHTMHEDIFNAMHKI